MNTSHLYRHIAIPDAFLTTTQLSDHSLRGTPYPQDVIVKLGDTLLAFDNKLDLLWQYDIQWNEYSRCSAYIPSVGDINGDGRDEINGVYYILNADGPPRWEKPNHRTR
jgi:hypothetical protein